MLKLGTKVDDMFKAWTKADDAARIEGVKRLGLPENNTAADRAKAMGFSDETYYHGTNSNIDEFDPQKTAMGNIWYTDNPKMTDSYTSNVSQGAGNVIPLKVKKGNVAGWDEYDQLGLGELETRGYDSTWLPSKDGQSSGFVLDPSKLRSPLAHFNPKMAGVGAGSILSANLMANELDLEHKPKVSAWDSLMNTIGGVNQQQAQAYGDTGAGTFNIAGDIIADPSIVAELGIKGMRGTGLGMLLQSNEVGAAEKPDFFQQLQRQR